MRFIKPSLMQIAAKDATKTENIEGPSKVLGKDFLIPEDEKGNLIVEKGILNGNTIVLGASGCGKTYMYIRPNIKANLGKKNFIWIGCAYGLDEVKDMMPGYDIKYLSVPNKKGNVTYNPFKYVSNKTDLIDLVNTILDYINIKHPQTNINKDPFYEEAKKILLQAILTYAYFTIPKNELSFTSVCNILKDILQAENKHDCIQKMIDILSEKNPDDNSIGSFKTLLTIPSKTLDATFKSMFPLYISLHDEISNIFDVDTLNITDIFTKGNQAIIVPLYGLLDYINYNYIVNILVQQIFNQCYASYEMADFKNKLVDVYLDEFGSYNFNNFLPFALSMARNYGINVHIILQALMQGYARYDKAFDIIMANCDTKIFMGSPCIEDARIIYDKYFESNPTSIIVDTTKTKNALKCRKHKAYIMSPDNLEQLDPADQLVFIKSYEPILTKKPRV